jgi:hypothetical protein
LGVPIVRVLNYFTIQANGVAHHDHIDPHDLACFIGYKDLDVLEPIGRIALENVRRAWHQREVWLSMVAVKLAGSMAGLYPSTVSVAALSLGVQEARSKNKATVQADSSEFSLMG